MQDIIDILGMFTTLTLFCISMYWLVGVVVWLVLIAKSKTRSRRRVAEIHIVSTFWFACLVNYVILAMLGKPWVGPDND